MDAPKFPGFEILEKMPQGAMGTVYKARQISLDRIVALKILPPNLSADSADVGQFLFEARIAAKLKHQNIVRVYDFGRSAEGIYYFVMEFVSGYSVADWIQRKKSLSEENSLLIAQSVADALGYAWEKVGVIHCDIKPDNIMIDGDGSVKVADLGLAKSVLSVMDKAKTATGIVFGTPNYISPEQSRGDVELDCRTDIYSLGAMLYHCMTGKMAFEGLPPVKVMDLQITDQILDPQDVNPHISTESACLIEKMMAKAKDKRQKDWKSVSEDISRVKSHQMPLGELPEPGASTIKRSAQRGVYPRLKVKAPKVIEVPEAPETSRVRAESSTFIEMERKFEEKQKRRLLTIKPEWWFATVITVAVLVLAGLILRSMLIKSKPQPASEAELKTGVEVAPDQSVAQGLPVTPGSVKEQEKNAREMFEFAMQWFEQHPEQYDGAIQSFEKVGLETSGTKYSLMASAEIQKIRYLKRNAIEGVLNTLREQAAGMASNNHFIAAAELYEQYQDALAEETASTRQLRAKEWRAREQTFSEQQRVANQQWQNLIEAVVMDLVNADPEAALARVGKAGKSAPMAIKKSELDDLQILLTEASRMNQRLLDSFRAQKDQEIEVNFLKSSEKLVIRKVADDHVEAEKVVVLGAGHVSQPKSFRISDLALVEKSRRLGSDKQPEVVLMKGLLMVQAGDFQSARSFFDQVGSPLSVPLVETLNEKQKLGMEENARQTLSWLMRSVQIDIPEKIPGCEDCLTAIRKKVFAKKDAQVLAKAVETYRKKYGNTEFAMEYDPVLARLSDVPLTRISPREELSSEALAKRKAFRRKRAWSDQPSSEIVKQKRASSESDLEAVRSALLERNPGLNIWNIMFKYDPSGRIVGVAIISPVLKDIQPLASLPHLNAVICSTIHPDEWCDMPATAPLSNLSSLKGLSLKELNLSHTMVRDISPLDGMPLSKVDLSYTKIRDLFFLKGMLLTELDISRTRIPDIRVLKGMPLERLNISGTDVDTILPLSGMKLSFLDISNTNIRDLNPLRGMALQNLNIKDTDVRDINMLRKMPLRRLMMARTNVRDISPLSGMPLVFLDIEETEVKDLSALEGMKIEDLKAGHNKISDLRPLARMSINHLNIEGTDVKDLSVLQTLSLTDLNIGSTKVKDLTQIKGIRLKRLTICSTAVKDLSPLRNMPLKFLNLRRTGVTDLSPIQNSPIEEICLDYDPLERHKDTYWPFTSVLRGMPRLKVVNGQPLIGFRKDD